MTVKPSNLAQNISQSTLIDLEESPESEPKSSKKKKKISSDPSPLLEHGSPQINFPEFDFPSNVSPEYEYIKPAHDSMSSKYGHVEYNPELFDSHQFDYGTPEYDLANTEVPATMPTIYLISQIKEKKREIENLNISLEEYNALD